MNKSTPLFLSLLCLQLVISSAFGQVPPSKPIIYVKGGPRSYPVHKEDLSKVVRDDYQAFNHFATLVRNDTRPPKAAIRKLAVDIGLYPTVYKEGDISYWFEAGLDRETLTEQFLARKIAYEASVKSGHPIVDSGDLSHASQQIRGTKEFADQLVAFLNSLAASVDTHSSTTIQDFPVRIGQFLITADDIELAKLKMSTAPADTDVRAFVHTFELVQVSEPNRHLGMLPGDINFWMEQRFSRSKYLVEFASRYVILRAAQRENIGIDSQGDLSYWAERPELRRLLDD